MESITGTTGKTEAIKAVARDNSIGGRILLIFVRVYVGYVA